LASFFSYTQNFSKYFFPPLFLFITLFIFYQQQTALLSQWFGSLYWLSNASLGAAGLIALQFGRSRIVFSCLLLMLISLPGEGVFTGQWLSSNIGLTILMLQVSYLCWCKDKGFALVNLLFSVLQLAAIALLSWYALSVLLELSREFLAPLQSAIFAFSPALSTLFTAFEWLTILAVFIFALLRFLVLSDNNHSALFFTLVVILSIQISGDPLLTRLVIFTLGLFYIYAILKDSFTMAFRDELTGIPSRRALMQYVQTLGRKYVVVMSDIDHFKKFNDSYGHDVGDEVLKLVASKLNKVGGGGKAFRYGGEEFIIIFPRKTLAEALPHVEALRQTIADYPIAIRAKPRPKKAPKAPSAKQRSGKTTRVTTSFGLAQRNSQVTDFSGIMKQADIALYAAKKAGRNCLKTAKEA
jgi:diguanylate cyclase (GGDEF)-like protein